MHRHLPVLAVLSGLGALVSITVAERASACSCSSGIYASWPSTDATDVALDTTIVLSPTSYSEVPSLDDQGVAPPVALDGGAAPGGDGGVPLEPEPTGLRLTAESGDVVGLRELRRLDHEPLCSAGYVFLEPFETLAPATRYELTVDGNALTAFTTAAEAGLSRKEREANAIGALSWAVAGKPGDPALVTTVFVEGAGAEPLFFQVDGSASLETLFAHPEFTPEPLVLQTGPMECVEIEVVGLSGDTLSVERFCGPERCFDSDIVGTSSCGGNPFADIDWERFQALDADSCGQSTQPSTPDDDVPDSPSDDDDTSPPDDDRSDDDAPSDDDDEPASVASRGVDGESSDPGGCSVSGTPSGSPLAWLVVALGMLGVPLRRR